MICEWQNRESTEGHSRWKVEKIYKCKIQRNGKFGKRGLNNWSIRKSQKGGTEPGVRKGTRSLLASQTRCKCSMETTRNSVKVNPGECWWIWAFEKKKEIWLSPMTKVTIQTENSKTKGQHTNATKNFDNTTIADRLIRQLTDFVSSTLAPLASDHSDESRSPIGLRTFRRLGHISCSLGGSVAPYFINFDDSAINNLCMRALITWSILNLFQDLPAPLAARLPNTSLNFGRHV